MATTIEAIEKRLLDYGNGGINNVSLEGLSLEDEFKTIIINQMGAHHASREAGAAIRFLLQRVHEGVEFDADLEQAALSYGALSSTLSVQIAQGVPGAWARGTHINKSMQEHSTGAQWLKAVNDAPWDLSVELPGQAPLDCSPEKDLSRQIDQPPGIIGMSQMALNK